MNVHGIFFVGLWMTSKMSASGSLYLHCFSRYTYMSLRIFDVNVNVEISNVVSILGVLWVFDNLSVLVRDGELGQHIGQLTINSNHTHGLFLITNKNVPEWCLMREKLGIVRSRSRGCSIAVGTSVCWGVPALFSLVRFPFSQFIEGPRASGNICEITERTRRREDGRKWGDWKNVFPVSLWLLFSKESRVFVTRWRDSNRRPWGVMFPWTRGMPGRGKRETNQPRE